ncbi:MAG: secretin N-terminal domain-containing protein, partial [Chthoniobacterales bacterium]
PLQRADAQKIVDTLNQVFGKEGSSSTPYSSGTPGKPPTQQASSQTTGADDEHILSGKAQFIADKRTNRILLITRAENYRYVRELIAKLDQAVQFEEPLVRPLNYMSSSDVFPVLVDMLKAKDDESTNNTATTQPSSQKSMNNSSNPTGGSGNNSSGGSSNPADRLADNAQPQPPQSAIIGSTSIIGDPTGNTLIVYGPPESKSKASQIIDLLDKRPQQVYLAAVIGQMKLDASTDFGSAYLFHYKGFNTLLSGGGFAAPAAAAATTLDTLRNAAASAGGLTAIGAVAGSLDVYANFLESTHKFRTIARPVVYTSNNRKATIFSGQSVPYNSSTQSSIVGAPANGATNPTTSFTQNVTYQDVTLKLEVIPLINSDNEVNLLISQQNKTIDEAGSAKAALTGISAPVINTQELNTSVRIPSGSTIVLGGLIQEDKSEDQKGVPYLNKIPVLGPLLGGHTNKDKSRTELIVMIQPIIVDSNFKMKELSNKEGGQSDLGKRSQDFEKKLEPTPPPAPSKKKFHLFPNPKVNNF